MLNYIRSNSQSFGVKLAFGLIILVFVFWGVGSMQSANPTTIVASVNDEPITVVAFERAYMQALDNVRRNNPEITQAQIQQLQVPQQVLQQMILAMLLQQEAKRLDIVISPAELRSAIEEIPAFHNDKGVFDPELYKRIITAQQQRLSDFENLVRDQLLEGKLRRDMTITGEAFSEEISAFFDFTYEQRDVEYLFFPMEDALAEISAPAEDSIKAHYESNKQAYSIPAKASIDYVVVSPTGIVSPASVTTDAVTKFYEDNKATFIKPARAKVSHILLTLAPDASPEEVEKVTAKMTEIEAELKAGASFSALATEYSQDTTTAENGGSLEWINVGDTVKPFNDKVFSMQNGEMSSPIRTDFGLHLIKVDEIEQEKTMDLAEVESDIRNQLAQEMGMAKLREVLDNLIEANILGNDLSAAAKKHNLELQNSGLLSAFELEKLLNIKPEGSAQIFATAAGVPLDASINADNNTYIVAKVKEKTNTTTRPFAEVKEEISKLLLESSAMEKTMSKATELRKTLDSETPAQVTEQIKLIADVQRDGDIGILGPQADLSVALFDAEQGAWLPVVYRASVEGKQGAVLARVAKIKDSQDAQLNAMEQIIGNVLSMQKKEKMFQLFMATLHEKAEIEILNEAYLNMIGNP